MVGDGDYACPLLRPLIGGKGGGLLSISNCDQGIGDQISPSSKHVLHLLCSTGDTTFQLVFKATQGHHLAIQTVED